jgi:hypothetical protein
MGKNLSNFDSLVRFRNILLFYDYENWEKSQFSLKVINKK